MSYTIRLEQHAGQPLATHGHSIAGPNNDPAKIVTDEFYLIGS